MGEAFDLFGSAADAAEFILRDVYRVDVVKALDPLNLRDFDKLCMRLARSLKGHAIPVEHGALVQAVSKLDVKWNELDAHGRLAVVERAQSYLGPPVVAKVLPKIDQSLAFYSKDIFASAKKNSVLKYDLGISPNMSATDERAAQFLRLSQGHFIRDKYGQRRDEFGDQARGIVASGIERGLGSADITQELYGELSMHTGRSESYWNMIAMVFANRARTSAQLFSYGEAGIDTYTWESVLDEATSLQCRFMHGRSFSVQGAVKSIQEVEQADNPNDVKRLQPFLNVSGNQLYARLPDEHGALSRLPIAEVTESALGQKDKTGSFKSPFGDKGLETIGFRMPPLHGRCRSTVIPSFEPFGRPAAAPAAPPEKPVAPPSAPKPSKTEALTELAAGTTDDKFYLTPILGSPELDHDYTTPTPYAAKFPPGRAFDAMFAENATDKKQKINSTLLATKYTAAPDDVATLIAYPKKLAEAPPPRLVKWEGKLFVVDGHETLVAQKLLGQKTSNVQIVDLDKPLKPAAIAPKPLPETVKPIGIHDPAKTLSWGKRAKHEGVSLNGVPLAPAAEKDWSKIPDIAEGAPPPPLKPGQKQGSGVVIVEDDGRVWIVEPKDHFGGYEHTWPKGKAQAGLTLQQNALKEAYEESGLDVEIVGHLGDFEGGTSNARYYVARRKGGAPWAAHWESSRVKLVPPEEAEKLLNVKRDKDILTALKAYQSAPADGHPVMPSLPKPPPPPPPAPHPVAPALAPAPVSIMPGDVVLGTKVGSAQGSNEGGTYRGTDGVLRYVKFYKDASQGPGEHLANAIYRDLGLGAPTSTTFTHEGKTAYASEILSGVQTLGNAGLTKERARDAMKGFLADVLTGNWDAAGASLDNMVVDANGKVLRIDNGGTFLMRAKAGRKDGAVLNAIGEWEKFFDGSVNPAYAKVAKAAGYDTAHDMAELLVPQIKQMMELRDAHGGWGGYVQKMIGDTMPSADKEKIVTMLESRSLRLEAKLPELTAPKPKKLPNGPVFEAPKGVTVKAPAPDHEVLAIRRIEDLPKRQLPQRLDMPPDGSDVSKYKARAAEHIKSADAEQRSAIHSFTGSSYTKIRAAQRMTRAEWDASHHYESYDEYVKMAAHCEGAFDKVKPIPGQVFRGLRNLPRAVIDQLMAQDVIELGGTSSTSRTARVAIDSFMGGTSGTEHRALLVIHQKTGIPIETISGITSENEILMSKNSKLKVLARHKAIENEKILILECEEISDAVQPPDAPKKKPRARRKPAGSS